MENLWLAVGGESVASFRDVFSALWHWPTTIITATTTTTTSSTSPNAALLRGGKNKQSPPPRKSYLTNASFGSNNADYDSHRLAVQYAIGCTSSFDQVTKADVALFLDRFGPLEGSPPMCVLRARASLIIDRSNGVGYQLVRWYHGETTRTNARHVLT